MGGSAEAIVTFQTVVLIQRKYCPGIYKILTLTQSFIIFFIPFNLPFILAANFSLECVHKISIET